MLGSLSELEELSLGKEFFGANLAKHKLLVYFVFIILNNSTLHITLYLNESKVENKISGSLPPEIAQWRKMVVLDIFRQLQYFESGNNFMKCREM